MLSAWPSTKQALFAFSLENVNISKVQSLSLLHHSQFCLSKQLIHSKKKKKRGFPFCLNGESGVLGGGSDDVGKTGRKESGCFQEAFLNLEATTDLLAVRDQVPKLSHSVVNWL